MSSMACSLSDSPHNHNHPTVRMIKGRQYTHIRHCRSNLSGTDKIFKRAINDEGKTVTRLVHYFREYNEQKLTRILHGLIALEKLKDVDGIHHPYGCCIADRIQHQNNYLNKKIEIYDYFYEDFDLWEILRSKTIEPETKKHWMLILLKALSIMHERGIYHRDIKEENIVADLDGSKIAICDFDFCWMNGDPLEQLQSCLGTPATISPESKFDFNFLNITNRTTSESLAKNDVWSMGLVLFHIWEGYILCKNRFPTAEDFKRLSFICNEPLDPIMHVIWEMLQLDPKKRISAEDAYKKMKAAIEKPASDPQADMPAF